MTIDIAIKYMTNREGLRFFTQRWIPANPKALIVLVHGLGDYSGRYAHVINRFAQEGYAVAAYDHRGHGRSDGRRGDIDSFGQLVEDLYSFVWDTRHEVPPHTPVFLVAMSVGALIALHYMVAHSSEVDGLVALSPCFDLNVSASGWMKWCGRKATPIMPRLKIRAEFDPADLSRDQEVVDAYQVDPFVFQSFTLRTCQQIQEVTSMVMPLAFRIHHPLLLMHAHDDRICSADATRNFYDLVSDARKRLIIYEGSFHDPLNDIVRDEAFGEICAWLESHVDEVHRKYEARGVAL